MTREEKRYFKLYIKGLGKIEGLQIRLFDFLSKQEKFDRVMIKKQLKELFPSQNKSALQIKTYQNILKCLNLFHAKTYTETQILDALKTIRIFYAKNLFPLALTEVEKAKKMAIEYKHASLLPKILFWELRLKGQTLAFENLSNEAIEKHFQDFEQVLEELNNIYIYRKSWTEFYLYVRHSFGHKDGQHTSTNPACIQNLPPPLHYHSFWEDCKTRALQTYLDNDYQSGIDLMIGAIEETEKNPKLIKEYFQDYMGALYRVIGSSIATKQWAVSQQYIKKMEAIPKSFWTPNTTATYCELLFHYHFRFGELTGAQKASQKAIKLLKEHRHQISQWPAISLILAISSNAFYHKKYDSCIDFLMRLEDEKYRDINAQNTAKILLMLAYYEKKEYILLPYVIRSNYRFFKKDGPRQSFGYAITKSLSKVSKTISKEKATQIFIQLREELATNHKSYYSGTLKFFDLRAWLDSKIHHCDIATSLIKYRDKDLVEY